MATADSSHAMTNIQVNGFYINCIGAQKIPSTVKRAIFPHRCACALQMGAFYGKRFECATATDACSLPRRISFFQW